MKILTSRKARFCEVSHSENLKNTQNRTKVDEAHSETTDRRPNFQKMIEDSSKGLFDIVLVHKLDRFSRNRYDSAIYKSRLKKNHVTIASVLKRIDDSLYAM